MSRSSVDTLPHPFAWIAVPAGKVKVIAIDSKEKSWESYIPRGTSQLFNLSAFEIAKYPVTNAQFSEFIAAGGYNHRQWWTDEGWEARTQGLKMPIWDGRDPASPKVVSTGTPWSEPLYWQAPKWNKPDYPVVGVSWYEAIAFCQWLTELTGERISLPTEQQWQRAAQGDTDWPYAWGPSYGYDRCNWNAEGTDPNWDPKTDTEGTTPVTQYEGKGDSPFEVVDMNGNVWEWCLTKFESGDNTFNGADSRIARGGGWALLYSYELNLGTTDRMALAPFHRLDDIGFRMTRS